MKMVKRSMTGKVGAPRTAGISTICFIDPRTNLAGLGHSIAMPTRARILDVVIPRMSRDDHGYIRWCAAGQPRARCAASFSSRLSGQWCWRNTRPGCTGHLPAYDSTVCRSLTYRGHPRRDVGVLDDGTGTMARQPHAQRSSASTTGNDPNRKFPLIRCVTDARLLEVLHLGRRAGMKGLPPIAGTSAGSGA